MAKPVEPGDRIAVSAEFSAAYWDEFEKIGPKHANIVRWLANNPHWTIPSEWIASYVGKEGLRDHG